MAGSPSPSQQDDDLQTQNPTPTVASSPPPAQQQEVPNPETLETPDHTNPQPLTLDVDDHENQNPKQLNKDEDTLLVLDEELQLRSDNQSGTIIPPSPSRTTTEEIKHAPPPPPLTLTSPTNRRLPSKRQKRKYKMIKVQTLIDNLNPIPFTPTKTLDLIKHEEVLKRLGLWEFSKIEFDRSIRVDLVSQLIVNYDSRIRGSYVEGSRVSVNRADLARALKLPLAVVDSDSEVFSNEAIRFVEDFVLNWMLLHEDTWMMPPEVANWTRCIKEGHPEKLDSASLIWYMVEKELNNEDKLVDCYYASHLQYLIRSQRCDLFKSKMEVEEDNGVFGDGPIFKDSGLMMPMATEALHDKKNGMWRGHAVGAEAKMLLHAVEGRHPNTFEGVQTRSEAIWLPILKEFCKVIKCITDTSAVTLLVDEQVISLRGDLCEFERFGFNLSWAHERLTMVEEFKLKNHVLQKELEVLEESFKPVEETLNRRRKELVQAQAAMKDAQIEYDRAKYARNNKAAKIALKFENYVLHWRYVYNRSSLC